MTEKTLTMPELARFQAAMSDQLRDRLARLRKPGSVRATTEQAAADLADAQQALATAQQQREAALKNWDDRIAQLQARVELLQRQQTDIAAHATSAASPKAGTSASPTAAAKAKAPASRKPKAPR